MVRGSSFYSRFSIICVLPSNISEIPGASTRSTLSVLHSCFDTLLANHNNHCEKISIHLQT